MRTCTLFGKEYVWVRDEEGRLTLEAWSGRVYAAGGPITDPDLLEMLRWVGEG